MVDGGQKGKEGTMQEEDVVVLVEEDGADAQNPDGTPKIFDKHEAHSQGLRHRAISVFVFNHAGELLLQRRALDKYHSGGLWSNTCCSHPRPGEMPAAAARRRLWEEMRVSCPLEHVMRFSYYAEVGRGMYENEVDDVFAGWSETTPTPDPKEASDWKWMHREELKKSLILDPEKYTYWLKVCFNEVMDRLFSAGS